MKPFTTRVQEAIDGTSLASSAREAYHHVLQILAKEREAFEKEIWDKRITSIRYKELRAEYRRLKEDIALVEALLGMYEGKKSIVKPPPHVRKPGD